MKHCGAAEMADNSLILCFSASENNDAERKPFNSQNNFKWKTFAIAPPRLKNRKRSRPFRSSFVKAARRRSLSFHTETFHLPPRGFMGKNENVREQFKFTAAVALCEGSGEDGSLSRHITHTHNTTSGDTMEQCPLNP